MSAPPAALRADVNRVDALLREELASQRRLGALLEEQRRAVVARTPDALEDVTGRLEQELASAAARRQRRDELLRRVARTLGVAPSALTLGSLVERLGADGARLGELRLELRGAAADVVRANRQVAAAVALHRRLNQEVIELCFAETGGASTTSPLSGAGTLIDAEV